MKKLLVTLFVLGIFFLNSCRNENEEELYPCASVSVSFTIDVEPILVGNCNPCHYSGPASGDPSPSFETYADFKSVASDASSNLLCRINHENGCEPWMPLGGDKLPDSNITTIEAWISQCYPP